MNGELSKRDQSIKSIQAGDVERFRGKYVVRGTGCWEWTGNLNRDQYGMFGVGRRRTLAHRVAFYLSTGCLPQCLDHLCRNRKCVNSEHLEAVTPRINLLRGNNRTAFSAVKTHCVHGHEFTPQNTSLVTGKAGFQWRICKACHVIRQRANRRRRAEEKS